LPPPQDLRDAIDLVKERVGIEVVIGRRVQLSRKGVQYVGLCPFHGEKTPSFYVTPEKGFFKCFGCDKGGDHINFLQEIDGLSFREALAVLAEEAGVELPSYQKESQEERDVREQAREAMSRAKSLYKEALKGPAGADARAYLRGRGVTEEAAAKFELGWSPGEPGWLSKQLLQQGIPLEAIELAGLGKPHPQGGGRVRDQFWERLMFPVMDRAHRAIGFVARFLPESRAEQEGRSGKYVNSPDGPLFPKRRTLYGIDQLQEGLREAGEDAKVVLCEGNLDVVLLHQAGFRTTLATLGTSITPDHARTLGRVGRSMVLLFDGDSAGKKAAFKAARLFVEEGVLVEIAELPEGKDPADMIAEGEQAELSQILENPRDILDWRLDAWAQKRNLNDPVTLNGAAQECAEWISLSPMPVLVDSWSRKVENRLNLRHETLRRLIAGDARSANPSAPGQPSAGSLSPQPTPQELLARNEQEVVSSLLCDPSLYPAFQSILDQLQLSQPISQRLLAWIQEQRQQGQAADLEAALLSFVEESESQILSEIRLNRPPDPEIALERALAALPGNMEQVQREERRVTRQKDAPSDDDLRNLQRKIDRSAQG